MDKIFSQNGIFILHGCRSRGTVTRTELPLCLFDLETPSNYFMIICLFDVNDESSF